MSPTRRLRATSPGEERVGCPVRGGPRHAQLLLLHLSIGVAPDASPAVDAFPARVCGPRPVRVAATYAVAARLLYGFRGSQRHASRGRIAVPDANRSNACG